ncbi:MAG: response regulator [Pseudomonadota bacterium]|nr:response regulator [Pseudomonadota bacterium]
MYGRAPIPTVYILDDDAAVLDSLSTWLDAMNIRVRTWSDPRGFLDEYRHDWCGCLILDIRMPALSGLGLQEELVAIGSTLPIIFMTGHGSVSTAVQAMKAGAFEFIEKPFDNAALLQHIHRAFELDAQKRDALQHQRQIRERLATLTPRETEVLDYIVNGKATKVIALELKLSQRTVEIYRANVMQKMQSKSVAQLVKMLGEFGGGMPQAQ